MGVVLGFLSVRLCRKCDPRRSFGRQELHCVVGLQQSLVPIGQVGQHTHVDYAVVASSEHNPRV